MWMSATSPDRSIHIIQGETGMNQSSGEHSLLNLLKVNLAPIWYSVSCWSLTRFCYEHCHASLWMSIFVVSVGGIRTSNYPQWSCEWPELKFHWLWLELSRQLVESLHITYCWRSCHWGTPGKLAATVNLCSTLWPVKLSKKASVPCFQCRGTVEIFHRVSFHWVLLQFITSPLLANLSARSRLSILLPTNSLSCESDIILIFRSHLEILPNSGQDTLFYFGSTCSEKIIYKKV